MGINNASAHTALAMPVLPVVGVRGIELMAMNAMGLVRVVMVTVADGVSVVFRDGVIAEVGKAVVSDPGGTMANAHPFGEWANEGFHDDAVHELSSGLTVPAELHAEVT